MLKELFGIDPKSSKKAIVKGDKYRFTVLTNRMIRAEWSEDGVFEDRPTKMAVNRNFPVPKFDVIDNGDTLEIVTDKIHLYYDKKEFSADGLSVFVQGTKWAKSNRWFYGIPKLKLLNTDTNLKGTCCTLDFVDGECELEDGVCDRYGFSQIDDSNTMVMTEDGWFEHSGRGKHKDLYLFFYIEDFKTLMRDYAHLSGKTPMIPRYALGNWWSRYYKYTEKTYNDLLDKFAEKQIPLSVSVLDMDWHLVGDVPLEYGGGWTGYTFNKKFFPNPKRFLKNLHERGLATTFNIHPADGIRAFEDCYESTAKAMGIDPKTKRAVEFNAGDKKFMDVYCKKVLGPLEKMGVDFWWIDWQQQGGATNGYDPLWMLNHCIYSFGAKDGKYPMTLSRYAGLGSQRYPLGFSGDTIMSWESLDFQPYFTNCASNVSYGWWSHDIGGHKNGVWSDDMQIRWLQYGVFSPIVRLHSGKDLFMLKEPWNFPETTEAIMTKYMRLRHALVPYLYTMNYVTHTDGLSLCRPAYYEHPHELNYCLDFRNQYYFGTELMVCPITEPTNAKSGTGSVFAYIPKGDFFDFETGRHYKGEKQMMLYRTQYSYPVLAKAGAIVPLADDGFVNGTPLPKTLKVKVYAGANGSFDMYEDNEEIIDTKSAVTPFGFKWGKKSEFSIGAVKGEYEIPESRNYNIEFVGATEPKSVKIERNGKTAKAEFSYCAKCGTCFVSVENVKSTETVKIIFETDGKFAENDFKAEIAERVARYQIEVKTKQHIMKTLNKTETREAFAAQLPGICEEESIMGEFTEILTSAL